MPRPLVFPFERAREPHFPVGCRAEGLDEAAVVARLLPPSDFGAVHHVDVGERAAAHRVVAKRSPGHEQAPRLGPRQDAADDAARWDAGVIVAAEHAAVDLHLPLDDEQLHVGGESAGNARPPARREGDQPGRRPRHVLRQDARVEAALEAADHHRPSGQLALVHSGDQRRAPVDDCGVHGSLPSRPKESTKTRRGPGVAPGPRVSEMVFVTGAGRCRRSRESHRSRRTGLWPRWETGPS